MALVLNQRVTWRLAIPVVIDVVLVVLSVVASAFLVMGADFRVQVGNPSVLLKLFLLAAVFPFAMYLADVYESRSDENLRGLFVRLMQSLGVTALAFAAIYALLPGLIVGRGVFVLAVGFILGLVPLWRTAFDQVVTHFAPGERILFIGTKPAAVTLARELRARQRDLGVEVVGFLDAERSGVRHPGIIGDLADITELVDRHQVDRVIVSVEDARGTLPMAEFLDLKLRGIRFDHLATVYEEFTGRIAVENLRPSWLVFSDGFREPRAMVLAKRAGDVFVSGVALMVAAPVMLAVALAIRLTSAGPVFYHQVRVGQRGRHFTVHKFRTMRVDAEALSGPVFASERDPRVTPIGEFLRRTRLDELPQIWNILSGEMSLVGPRPERPEFVKDLTKQIPFYGQRHVVKPGLTGWAQVRNGYTSDLAGTIEKLQYDLFYIKNLSVVLDLVILFSTVKTVLRRQGAR